MWHTGTNPSGPPSQWTIKKIHRAYTSHQTQIGSLPALSVCLSKCTGDPWCMRVPGLGSSFLLLFEKNTNLMMTFYRPINIKSSFMVDHYQCSKNNTAYCLNSHCYSFSNPMKFVQLCSSQVQHWRKTSLSATYSAWDNLVLTEINKEDSLDGAILCSRDSLSTNTETQP